MEIVCSRCKAINRVPTERLQDGPVCGACKHPILPPEPVELTTDNFDAVIARSGLPVMVDFWAPWCGPCRSMAPMYAEAARQLHGRAVLAKVDTEAQPALAARFGIRSIPTLAIFRTGHEVAREAGARPAPEIVRWVTPYLE
ncbi:thioredoxin TrxC [Uliginosibacterium sp. 31-16]|uniref:thioredoxin TrxC n=1 Tax=Uliginosibacterium sp. 31-16 TaxID=3068315 RepID=UPI00273CFD95|nr:thioredoxin TrxC [Uliginosibacterium sp. 31-16]MDP5239307.1 thioredoxin TrxC [Uliginosibacterium sp. 31-16]